MITKISDIQYYYKLILQNNNNNFKFNYYSNINIDDLAYCIFYEAKINLINKYNIISQSTDNYYYLLLEQMYLIQQGLWNWAKNKVKTTAEKIKTVAKTVGNKIAKTASDAWNSCKNIAANIWEGIKKLGATIYNWFKAAIAYMKQGFSLLFERAPKKDMGFSQPSNIIPYQKQIKKNQSTAFSCLACEDAINSLKTKQNIAQINSVRNTLINGGNADDAMNNAFKNIGNSALSGLKTDLDKGKAEAEKTNQKLKKSNQDKLIYQTIQFNTNNKNLYNYLNQLSNNKNIQMKEYLIQEAFNGKTPKMLFNQKYSISKQNDIIIGGSKLSFKTNNGNLICEEYNLKTKNTIIYETNHKFLGNHIIYEETENKFKLNKNILFEQNQSKEKKQFKLCTADIIMIGKAILTIVAIITTIVVAIETIIAICTSGISLVAAPVVHAGATPPLAILSFKGIFGLLSIYWLKDVPDMVKQIPQDIKDIKDQLQRKDIDIKSMLPPEQQAQYEQATKVDAAYSSEFADL